MEPFRTLTAVAAPFVCHDVDTDKLIPHRFLRKPLSVGYGQFLFFDERFTQTGEEHADFVLNRPPYRRARILVTGRNFGCGSSREAAVYALSDFGIKAIIAESYGDIFRANCLQNGLIPIVLAEELIERIGADLEKYPGATVTVDLKRQTVITPDRAAHQFDIDASRKAQILEGLDDIDVTSRQSRAIDAFEQAYRSRLSWLPRPRE
ncbi:MAG: 3-isopropylmalate dehydratase small subunit [Betaproteobacteria bacterium]|nr:3-isopropylmalate dehydratase small subunit [Betaproteobacteria bacterium]